MADFFNTIDQKQPLEGIDENSVTPLLLIDALS
ncbi:hypothetical protein AB7M22_001649 [Pseudomonas sp. ADAK2 TE3594]